MTVDLSTGWRGVAAACSVPAGLGRHGPVPDTAGRSDDVQASQRTLSHSGEREGAA